MLIFWISYQNMTLAN